MRDWRNAMGSIGLLAVATIAQAEERAWDSREVRDATEDLVAVGTMLRASLNQQWEAPLATAIDSFVVKADVLRDAIERGDGKADAWPLYLELRAARLRIAENARIQGISVAKEEVEAFQAVFRQLEAYFEP
jgi:hypothetical protein